jgi:cell division GTPase FtsZ
MLTPIEVALVGLIIVQIVLHHLRKTHCDERVQRVEDETRRNTVNAYTQVHRHAFELYRDALEDAGAIKPKEKNDVS